jgi:nitroreductase
MADNYLEKRYEETLGNGKTRVKRIGHTVDELLTKNRSTRGYKKAYKVSRSELERIAGVCTRIPSARNQQVLRMRLVTHDSGADLVLPLVKMGAALPELHLPFPGTEPEAFIVVCSTVAENPMVDIDLGIAAQSILLKAVEMGLNGIFILNMRAAEIRRELDLPSDPLAVIAIGKGTESIFLMPVEKDADLAYFRKDGVHYVPKHKVEDLLI